MRESTFIILRDLIHQHTGLFYPESKQDVLADKLYPRLVDNGFDSFLDYYYLLKYDRAAEQEWYHLMDALSVPETYFWREIDQIESLVKVILPEYLKDLNTITPDNPITIWSAACATGEEPISIAIALKEAGFLDQIPIKIFASDASSNAIEKAKKGIYRERSFRSLSSYLKLKYFKEKNETWQIIPEIHNHINWQIANICNPLDIKHLSQANFIFCRNVFIYFSDKAIKNTVNQFYQGLSSPGYLFISASESLLKFNTGFELQEIGGAFVYVKK